MSSISGKAAPSTARRAAQHPGRWARGAEALPPLRAIRCDSRRSYLTQETAAASCTRDLDVPLRSGVWVSECAQYGTEKQKRKNDVSAV